jgi:hypothetical protein
MELINEQNSEWTSLVQRQLTEMNALRRQHTKEQCDLLRLLLDETQKNQIKEITDRHLKYKKIKFLFSKNFFSFLEKRKILN